ncbi:MAG TPA: hypothetical protein DEP28_02880 [Bacteroidetes bacterium]|nr:hypothetical protein [Bacteroidota bacterium]
MENGEKNNLTIFEFVKEALIRELGTETYNQINENYLNKC